MVLGGMGGRGTGSLVQDYHSQSTVNLASGSSFTVLWIYFASACDTGAGGMSAGHTISTLSMTCA
jgi:hypothetical protein